MVKRCKFCARKLNDSERCTNVACPDNLRREIIEKTEQTEAKDTAAP